MTKAEVEMFYNSLIMNHVPTSEDDLQALKAKLTDFTHALIMQIFLIESLGDRQRKNKIRIF